jgi:hypothetical protein
MELPDIRPGKPFDWEIRMHRLFFAVFVFLMIPLAALAQQDYPKAEVFGGYSYFRANPEDFDLHGWNASVTGNLTNWFGIEGDFSGHYGKPSAFGFTVPGVDINHYTFMGGPKLAYRKGPITPFAHFLIGAARAGTKEFFISTSDTALAAAIGGGIDIGLGKYFAVRAIQADYLMTRFKTFPESLFNDNERQNNFRFSAGIVFRF